MKLSDVTTFLKKYFTKSVLITGLVILSCVAMYTSCNSRAKLVAARSELASSQTLNTIAATEKQRLESLVDVYKDSIQTRDAVLKAKDKKIMNQLGEISSLQDTLNKTLIDLGSVTADVSYRYINQRVMPKSERKFPFDSVQVKAIHYTFIERDGLFDLNNKLSILVTDLHQSSSIKDNQILDLNSLMNVYLQREGLCKLESDAYKTRVEGLTKDVKKQKFLKTLLLPPAVVGILAVAIKLLIK